MSHEDRRSRVSVICIQLLDRCHVRLYVCKQSIKLRTYLQQSLFQWCGAISADQAGLTDTNAGAILFDCTVAGNSQTRIQTKNPQRTLPFSRETDQEYSIA